MVSALQCATCALEAIENSGPFRPVRRALDRDPLEAAIVEPMQRVVEDRGVARSIGRHLLCEVRSERTREPEISAAAARWKSIVLDEEQRSSGTVVPRMETGRGLLTARGPSSDRRWLLVQDAAG